MMPIAATMPCKTEVGENALHLSALPPQQHLQNTDDIDCRRIKQIIRRCAIANRAKRRPATPQSA